MDFRRKSTQSSEAGSGPFGEGILGSWIPREWSVIWNCGVGALGPIYLALWTLWCVGRDEAGGCPERALKASKDGSLPSCLTSGSKGPGALPWATRASGHRSGRQAQSGGQWLPTSSRDWVGVGVAGAGEPTRQCVWSEGGGWPAGGLVQPLTHTKRQ